MEIQEYLNKKKEVQASLLQFIDNDDNSQDSNQNILKYFKDPNYQEYIGGHKEILYLISRIANHHRRLTNFYSKLEQILFILKDKIKQTYSNFEIYQIFKGNKKVLLFLIKNDIITIDQQIINDLLDNRKERRFFIEFLFPEVESYLSKHCVKLSRKTIYNLENISMMNHQTIQLFESKRSKGENENYICQLIRNDSIDEFISFVNSENVSLSRKVLNSVFETNSYLVKNEPSLIEYAAFYGSIQIFQFLRANNVEMNSKIWFYSIHGRNVKIIYCLEDCMPIEDKEFSLKCYQESLKCHHLELVEYFATNYLVGEVDESFNIKYMNFKNFPSNFENKYIEYYLCKYDYFDVIKSISKLKLKADKNKLLKLAANNNNFDVVNFLIDNYKFKSLSFKDCKMLSKFVFHHSFNLIQNFAFKGCLSLTEINIPSSVEKIGEYAFSGCIFLKKIYIPSSVIEIGQNAFSKCLSLTEIEILSKLQIIEAFLFCGCSSLKEIKIPSSVTSIGRQAFSGCLSLEKIEIPSSVSVICEYAFNKCKSLKKIELPPLIEVIKTGVFYDCHSLAEILIPSTVTNIGSCSFENCKALKKVSIQSVTILGSYAFSCCKSLEEVIMNSVIKVDVDVFNGCSSLIEISIPSSELKIAESMFEDCHSLKKVTFQSPSSVTSIDKNSFKRCSSLIEISIPSSVKVIGKDAFEFCRSLSKVSFEKPSNLISISKHAFDLSSLTNISIPSSAKFTE